MTFEADRLHGHPLRRFQHDAASYCSPDQRHPACALRCSGSGAIE